jgi:hypothetical protein
MSQNDLSMRQTKSKKRNIEAYGTEEWLIENLDKNIKVAPRDVPLKNYESLYSYFSAEDKGFFSTINFFEDLVHISDELK